MVRAEFGSKRCPDVDVSSADGSTRLFNAVETLLCWLKYANMTLMTAVDSAYE